jgi:hypothetical protein
MDRLITLLPKPKVAAAAIAAALAWVALRLGVKLDDQALNELALAAVTLAAAWWKRDHQPPNVREQLRTAGLPNELIDVEPHERPTL